MGRVEATVDYDGGDMGRFERAYLYGAFLLVGLIALLWTGLDELSQALPGVERSVTWQDFTAGAVGVTTALMVIALVSERRDQRSVNEPKPQMDTDEHR